MLIVPTRVARALLALALMLVAAGGVHAQLALSITGSTTLQTSGAPISVGFSFTTSQPVSVVALADFNPGSGQQVRLYDTSGTVLASTTVSNTDPTDGSAPNGGSGPQTFNVRGIAPVGLAGGQTYFVAADVPDFNVGGLYYLAGLQGIATDPRIAYGHSVWSVGAGGKPQTDGLNNSFGPGYLGPNFRLATAAVPEPSSLLVAGVAGLGFLGARWRTRRAPRKRRGSRAK